jgi:hypothetical protein
MKIAAGKMKVRLPADLAVDAEVDLCKTGDAFLLQARLKVSLPGLEDEVAQALVDAAHQTCPYSKATRGNIDVATNVAQAGRVSDVVCPCRAGRPFPDWRDKCPSKSTLIAAAFLAQGS